MLRCPPDRSKLFPAQWRVFTPPGQSNRQYVLFWLLVDGNPYDFGHQLNTIPNPVKWWRNVVEESPAFDADILPGDVLLLIGSDQLSSLEQYGHVLDMYQGQTVKIRLNRNGVSIDKELTLRSFDNPRTQ